MAKLSSTHIYGDLYVDGTINGALSGNASTATTLQTARTINGTSFNGSSNITTANWGTARTITIGNTGKSVNGSGNVSWTLAEIGAAAASHGTHVRSSAITTGYDTAFRTKTKGDANSGSYFSTVRTDTASVNYAPQYGSGIAWGQGDTHGYLNVNYSSATAYLGGGSSDKLNWVKQIAFSDHNHDSTYAKASHGTHLTIGTGASNAAAGNHTHNYAGSGSAGGTANSAARLDMARISGSGNSANYAPGANRLVAREYGPDCTNIPSAHWYHIYTGQGSDTAYNTQLAIGMTTDGLYFRNKNSNTWGSWKKASVDGHTHNYAGSSSAGGAANSVKTNLIIKLNGGSTEGTNLFTFNGGTAKTVNITPSAIGAAASSHGTHLSLGTTSSTAYRGDYGNTAYKHSQAAHAPSNAQKNSDITKAEIEAKLTGNITSHTHSAYAAASHGTHLTIGTGSGNAAAGNHTHSGYASSSHSHDFFNVKGDNTITSTSNDNTTNWGNQGNSVHFYTTTGQLIDQPSQWGFLLNIGRTSEVHQIWMTQASGDMFHRGGNASGWSGSWRKLLDSSNWSSYAAASSHNHTQLTGEVRFPGSGSYTDPWSGITCAIKATGNVGLTGTLRANAGIYSTSGNGVATADGSTYAALLRYKDSRGYCDLGNNSIPGRLYIRSGQGTAGSGVLVECAVTNGNAYMQYLSPEAGTIALTRHLSDRTKKENIVYVGSEESEFTNKDFYDFIRDDLGLATYNYNEEYKTTDTHTKLNFIAQDILYDIEHNCINKVGNLIVQTEDAMEQQGSLRYDPEIYTSVIAGALKESINKIEELEDKNKKLEERLAMLEEKFSALENK